MTAARIRHGARADSGRFPVVLPGYQPEGDVFMAK